MTAKEIKEYLRMEEKFLWEEHLKVERELEEEGIRGAKQWENINYVISLAHWAIVWDIIKELKIEEE